MGDLSELIDTMDDDVNFHLANLIAGVDSRTVGVASTLASSSWVPFAGLLSVIL